MRYQIPVMAIIVLLTGLLAFVLYDLYFPETNSSQRHGRAITVRLAPVERKTIIESYEAIGTTRAEISIFIKSRQTVHIDQMFMRDNTFVKKGELLLTLDSSVEQALLDEAKVNLTENTRLLNHYQKLANKKAVSQTQLAEQRALVNAGEARVNAAKARVDNLEIRAPFTGRLGTWQATPGSLVTKERVINILDDTRTVKVDFTIPETYMGVINKELHYIASTPAYPGQQFIGQLDHINTQVDEETRAVTVRLNIPNDDGLLKPGMLLTLEIVKSKVDVLTIPEQALVPMNDKQIVYVINDNKAEQREVVIGRRRPGIVEIREGLALGEHIVIEGAFKLKPGYPVRVIEGTKPAEPVEKTMSKPSSVPIEPSSTTAQK